MPHHKSCIKRVKTSEKARVANKVTKTRIKTLTKTLAKAEGEEIVKAAKTLNACTDNAARKGIIKKNKASRLKARAQKLAASTAK